MIYSLCFEPVSHALHAICATTTDTHKINTKERSRRVHKIAMELFLKLRIILISHGTLDYRSTKISVRGARDKRSSECQQNYFTYMPVGQKKY